MLKIVIKTSIFQLLATPNFQLFMKITFISSKQIEHIPILTAEVIFVMPFTQAKVANLTANLMAERASYPGLIICVHDDHGDGFIHIVNRVFNASQSKWFGYVAQDAFPGRHWLRIAINSLTSLNGGLLGFNDGKWLGELAGFGLANRKWAQQNYQGQFFNPNYVQHYADTELSLLAQAADRYCYNPNSLLVEIDWDKDSKPANFEDKNYFQSRCKNQFDRRITNPNLLNKFL
jgi:hypothetical protein